MYCDFVCAYAHGHHPLPGYIFCDNLSQTMYAEISFADMVHRDLKLENILLSPDPRNTDDKFYIKVRRMRRDS